MKLLNSKLMCNAVRLRDRTITKAMDKQTQFKLVSSEESTILLQHSKDELPVFQALANDINANLFDMESILPLF